MYLFVTPVSLKMTEALTKNFKMTNDKNEAESANQIQNRLNIYAEMLFFQAFHVRLSGKN